MKTKKAAWVAAAVVLAAPAVFAQSASVQSTTTTTVAAPVGVILPSTISPISQRPLPNGAIAQVADVQRVAVIVPPVTTAGAPSTAVLGAAPAPGPVVQYYFNVPRDIQTRDEFQRWQRLL